MGPRGRGGWGFGPWAFGFGGCEPQAGPGFRWRFYDRGDLKFVILRLLREKPMHGYEVMRALEEGSGGWYRASPGSVYPTLQMLEEGGYVTSEQVDGKKVYTITDAGRKLLEDRGESRFEETPGMKQVFEIRQSLKKLASAVIDGARGSDEQTMKRIGEILDKARKEVYSVLAES